MKHPNKIMVVYNNSEVVWISTDEIPSIVPISAKGKALMALIWSKDKNGVRLYRRKSYGGSWSLFELTTTRKRKLE